MEPMYNELCSPTQKHLTSTKCGKVDGTSERGLSAVFDITGFPSMFYVSPDNKSVYKYKGRRSVEALKSYVGVGGGWEEDEPMSFWTGPYGIVGRGKWGLLVVGAEVYKVYEYLEPNLGMWGAGVVVGGGGILGMSLFIVGCMVWTQNRIMEQHNKRD